MSIFCLGIFLLSFTLLSSCTFYKKPKVPLLQFPERFKYSIQCKNPNLSYFWWENFNDPGLNELVERALLNNYNYLATIKNINIAQTYVTQYQANLFPQVNLTYNESRNKFSKNSFFNSSNTLNVSGVQTGGSASNLGSSTSSFSKPFNSFQLQASVSYELDVWNQIGNQVNQAKSTVGTNEANTLVVKLTLITSIVNTYFQIGTLNAALANLREQEVTARKLLQLNQDQYISGLIDIGSVQDAKNMLETIKINIDSAIKQKQGLQNTLAYWVGEYPENFKLGAFKLYTHKFSALIPPGLPSEMIANRPDIQSYYFQILSYGYLIKQNLAAFLPSFSLTANGGYSSAHFSNLISPGSTFWNYGLNIAQPIFDAGMRLSVYRRSKFQYEQAILNYKNTVMNAFQEVNTALSAYRNDHEAFNRYGRQLVNQKAKLDLAAAQYQSGYSANLNYLNYKLAFLEIQYNLINQRLAVIEDVIQVYKTLGLGIDSGLMIGRI